MHDSRLEPALRDGRPDGQETRPPRLLLLSPERVRERLAGVGIRFVEIARHLAAAQPVTLAIPNPIEEAPPIPGVTLVTYSPSELRSLAARHDVAIVQGHLANYYFHQGIDIPTVADLYDPFLIENLHYAAQLGYQPFQTDHATLSLQLARADFFLCSSQEQRFFYLGFLAALGRLHPDNHAEDASFERLLAVVPFGVPGAIAPRPGYLRAQLPGVGPDDPLLFFGGLYDWYDPDILLEAFPAILAKIPAARLVFVGHPNRDQTPQAAFDRVVAVVRQRGWEGTSVFFTGWAPYAERFDLFADADLAVVTHHPGLETELSLRTRFLDFMRAGLPIVATAGGALADLLERHDCGRVVPPGDAAGLAAAVTGLLADPVERRRLAGRAADLVTAEFAWDRVLAPLAEFCAAPRCDPTKGRFLLNREALQTPGKLARLRRRMRVLGKRVGGGARGGSA